MHTCIDVELIERFRNHHPYHLVEELKALFSHHVRNERYNLTKELMNSQLALGEPIKWFEITMISLEKRLRDIGFNMTHEHLCDIVLGSLPLVYHGFVRLYNSIAEEWPIDASILDTILLNELLMSR